MTMDILIQIALLLLGLALVVKGADFLVDGAASIARRYRVSEFVIGLTIVGFGTSCPELVVSATGAAQGSSDIAAGNVIGSNIFTSLFILGLTALLCPVPIQSKNRRFDLPVLIGVTILFIVLGMGDTLLGVGSSNVLSRVDAAVFLVLFAGYVFLCFKIDKNGSAEEPEEEAKKPKSMLVSSLLCLGGLAGLIFGGRLFVDSATNIAQAAGLSEKFIAITILAAGTSLPELVTCIVAARKGKIQLALGNIMGSNIFNILFIMGVSALIRPVSMENVSAVDAGVLIGSALLILLSCFTQRDNKVSHLDGAMMLAVEAAYIAYLIIKI